MDESVLSVAVPAQVRRNPAPDAAALLSHADADADALADALHDGVLQSLVVARYAADAAVRGGDPAAARDAVQEALVALRRQVWLLRPRGDEPLAESLPALAAHRGADAPLSLALDPVDPPPAARAVAYRFVQATTGPAQVALTAGPDVVVLEVTPAPDGLAAWAARAAAVGGRLEPPAAGSTTARLLLPHRDPEGDR